MNQDNVEIINIKTAKELVAVLRRSNDLWLKDGSSIHPWVFRGHRKSEWRLQPTAWRDNTQGSSRFTHVFSSIDNELIDRAIQINSRFPQIETIDRLRIHHFIAQKRFEFLEVQAFCSLVDDLGFALPGGPLPMQYSLNFTDPNLFDLPHHSLALAQHHGMHTRLIDWTRNPLAAAFFASEKVTEEDGVLAVWALDRRALVGNQEWRELVVPRSEIGFLHAQAGLFTFCPIADENFIREGKWPAMEDRIFANNHCDLPFRKLTLPWSEAKELRRLLYAESISKAHLMPTYDNVRETLRKMWDE